MSTSTAPSRTVQLPSGPVLVGAVYAVCVLGLIAVFTADILFTDKDPHRKEGPIESIVGVALFGTTALVVGVVLVLWLSRTADRARVGSLLLVALSVLTIIFFWSGAPGILGACAAWCAGLTRGSRPLGGAARVAGIVGTCIALLNVVLTMGGILVSGLAPRTTSSSAHARSAPWPTCRIVDARSPSRAPVQPTTTVASHTRIGGLGAWARTTLPSRSLTHHRHDGKAAV